MLLLKIGEGFELEMDVGVVGWKLVGSVFLRLGKGFEVEVGVAGWKVVSSVFLRLGKFERFWKTYGMPDGISQKGPAESKAASAPGGSWRHAWK